MSVRIDDVANSVARESKRSLDYPNNNIYAWRQRDRQRSAFLGVAIGFFAVGVLLAWAAWR